MATITEVKSRHDKTYAPIGCKQLAVYLLEAGIITASQVMVARYDQKATSMRFSEIVIARGWLSQELLDDLYENVIIPERIHQEETVFQQNLICHHNHTKKPIISIKEWAISKGVSVNVPEENPSISLEVAESIDWTRD